MEKKKKEKEKEKRKIVAVVVVGGGGWWWSRRQKAGSAGKKIYSKGPLIMARHFATFTACTNQPIEKRNDTSKTATRKKKGQHENVEKTII